MNCPFLDYRAQHGEQQFDEPRAFCTAVDEFVSPMRADICNDRYDLSHEDHCEIYCEYAPEDEDDI